MKRYSKLATLSGLALTTLGFLSFGTQDVVASDHTDSPTAAESGATDIADFYAWSDQGKTVAIITFAGMQDPGAAVQYDRDVLYTIHIDNTVVPSLINSYENPLPADNTNDNVADIQIDIRFGQDDMGEWGVRVEGIPGANGNLEGAVGALIEGDKGIVAQAGTFDDPFSFDLEGFEATIANAQNEAEDIDFAFGSVAQLFDDDEQTNTIVTPPDAFAGKNVHAVVIEFNTADVLVENAPPFMQLWATASKI